jgi:hypothetical protein
MAQVPRNDGFSVASSERAAFQGTQFVDPGIKFSTPDFSDAAERLDKAQTKVFDEIDTARTTAQITEFKKYAADRQRDFLNLHGEQALLPDKDGRSLIDREDENLRKMAEKLKGKLTPRQQRMFDKEAGAVFTSQYVTASHHVGQENYTFKVGSQTGKRDLALQLAAAGYNDDNAIAQSHKDVVASEQELGRIQGLSTDQVKANTQKSLSTMYRGSIEASLIEAVGDPAKAGRADLLLKTYSQYMLPADVAACRKLVDGHLDIIAANKTKELVTSHDTIVDVTSADYASNAVVNGKPLSEQELRTRASRAYFGGVVNALSGGRHKGDDGLVAVNKRGGEEAKDKWQYGAPRLTVAKAMEAAKRRGKDFNLQDFHGNDGYALALGNAHFGDMIVAFAGDEDKAAAAYYSSEEDVNKAVEAATKEGNVGDWLSHMDKETQDAVVKIRTSLQKSRQFELRDEKGNKIKADTAQYIDAKMGPMVITRPEMRERILQVDERAHRDPKWLEDRLEDAMKVVDQQKETYRQKQLNYLVEAKRALFAAGGNVNEVPRSVWANLDTNQQDALRELGKKIAIGDNSTDDEVFYRVYGNDSLLKTMTEQEFENLHGTVSGQKWEMLKKRRFELLNEEAKAQDQLATNRLAATQGKVQEGYEKLSITEVRTEVRALMGPKAFDDLDEDSQNLLVSRTRYKLALLGQSIGKDLHGKPMALSEQIASILKQEAIVGGFVSDTRKPVMALKVSDFKNRGDTDGREVVRQLARRRNAYYGDPKAAGRLPTESEENEALGDLYMTTGGLPYSLSGIKLSQPLVEHVKSEYRKERGRDPSSGDVLRAYLLFCTSGASLPYSYSGYGTLSAPLEETSDNYYTGTVPKPAKVGYEDDLYYGFDFSSDKKTTTQE